MNEELKQWNAGDYAIYTPDGFVPYSCYNTDQVDAIVQKNKELTEREAKLVEALKRMLSLNVLNASMTEADVNVINSALNTLSELEVK